MYCLLWIQLENLKNKLPSISGCLDDTFNVLFVASLMNVGYFKYNTTQVLYARYNAGFVGIVC